MTNLIDKINQEQLKKDVKPFNVGDSVRVHTIVKEGDKERVQIFTGIVIGRKGTLTSMPASPSAASATARVSSACSRSIRPASRRWKWKPPARPAAPS